VDVSIKKVGMRDGKERFVLVSTKTRQVITIADVSEASLRRFFEKRGVRGDLMDRCVERAQQRYAQSAQSAGTPKVNQSADTMGEDDLLFELGLDDDASVR
jgi:hypothetical protein